MHGMPPPPRYPEGTVRGLLASDLVTPQTRAVLLARLDAPPGAAPRALDESTCLVLPSRSEGLPRIVIEAFCRGRPKRRGLSYRA